MRSVKKLTRTLGFILAFCMTTTIYNTSTVLAASSDFQIDSNGVLTSYTGAGGDIVIPSEVKKIADFTFFTCDKLTSVTIPNSVTTIGIQAFSNSKSLLNIDVAPDNPNYLSDNGILFNKNKSELIQYPLASANTSYTIPNTVTKIDDNAFSNSVNLTNITIPDSVVNIGFGSFFGCSKITNVTIPSSINFIGNNAFSRCDNNSGILVDNNNLNYVSENGILFNKTKTELIQYPAGSLNKFYIIPSGVTSIDSLAFIHSNNLKGVVIPNTVKSIGDYAFTNCSNLSNITIPSSITKIGQTIFSLCNNLTINGEANSYIENYAKNNSVPFTTFNKMCDINNDGIIDIKDIALLSQAYDSKSGDNLYNINYDLNYDGTIDIYDLVLISNKIS